VPYLLVLQHHIITSKTCIVAPVVPAVGEGATLLAPRVIVASAAYRAVLLDMTSVAVAFIGDAVDAHEADDQMISAGLDAIFRGCPVGLPIR
jgi:hypothetical protein